MALWRFLTDNVSHLGYAQMTNVSPGYNAESDLDLQYAMNLVTVKQPVTLYQVGDMVEGNLKRFR